MREALREKSYKASQGGGVGQAYALNYEDWGVRLSKT